MSFVFGCPVGVSLNPDPQAEGYSYVNLAVVTTVGSALPDFVATRPVRGELGANYSAAWPWVVGCPGTLTS